MGARKHSSAAAFRPERTEARKRQAVAVWRPQQELPKASLGDTLALFGDVMLPTWWKGVIVRRPRVVGLAERFGFVQRGIRRMQDLRAKYGDGPLMLRKPGQPRAVILSAEDVFRALDNEPEPFATASSEKRAALAHFEPKVALISSGWKRQDRRRFNEEVLEFDRPVHSLADSFLGVVAEEAEPLMRRAKQKGVLDWDDFFEAWYPIVRRIVLGRAARNDHELTDLLARLRGHANFAFLRFQRKGLRARFHARLNEHLMRAEDGSLAAIIARTPKTKETAPSHQVAQWLFAYDPAGMATFRALALILAHPQHETHARAEIEGRTVEGWAQLPFLRASIQESLRLWPTTPAVLRQTTQETHWRNGTMPKGTSILIYAPYFHRDTQSLPFADSFAPEIWLKGDAAARWPLIPFSRGPALCPAHQLVPMTTSAMLAAMLGAARMTLEEAERLDPGQPMPATLDNYSLRFRVVG
jgi:cytochrome P450